MVSDTLGRSKDDMQADLSSYKGNSQLGQPFRKCLTRLLNGSWEDIRYSPLLARFRGSRHCISLSSCFDLWPIWLTLEALSILFNIV
jgi:hypothetical protein